MRYFPARSLTEGTRAVMMLAMLPWMATSAHAHADPRRQAATTCAPADAICQTGRPSGTASNPLRADIGALNVLCLVHSGSSRPFKCLPLLTLPLRSYLAMEAVYFPSPTSIALIRATAACHFR